MNQEVIAKIDALVPKLSTGTVSWFKEELAKILNPLREPHPEKNCYFEGQKRVSEPYRIFCGLCRSYGCQHTEFINLGLLCEITD